MPIKRITDKRIGSSRLLMSRKKEENDKKLVKKLKKDGTLRKKKAPSRTKVQEHPFQEIKDPVNKVIEPEVSKNLEKETGEEAPKKKGWFSEGNKYGVGRPEGSKSKAQLRLEQIGYDNAEEIMYRVVQMAKEGNIEAIRFVMGPLYKPRPGNFINYEIDTSKPHESAQRIIEKMNKEEITDIEGLNGLSLIQKNLDIFHQEVEMLYEELLRKSNEIKGRK